jgi:KDO2-lipid IV(A) lauroyltransferase
MSDRIADRDSPAQGRRPRTGRTGETRAGIEQAPEVGLARRLLGRFHVTGVFWYQFHCWGMRILPSWLVGPVIVLFTSFFFLSLRRIRRALAANLEAALGPCGWLERQGRIWRTMWNHAWCNSERYERLSTDRPFEVTIEGKESWPGGSGLDRGLVLITAHVGAWDVGSFLPGMVQGRHVHVVREQEMDEDAQAFIEELYRETTSDHFTTHFSRDNPVLGATLLAALRRGEIVGIQGDRAATRGRTAEARLLGRPIHLPAGPAALARAAGAPSIPVFCFREGRRRYRCVIRAPILPAETGDQQEDLERMSRAIADEIGWAIREKPHQWFCFRALWG